MNLFDQQQEFAGRHIGPGERDTNSMLTTIGASSMEELINKTVPESIRLKSPLKLPAAQTEFEYLSELKKLASKNKIFRSYIGQGYYNTITPSVILRNVFENPGWYTQYTPYQAEISQGRLESLLNFQTMVCDLTGLELANASLLDEGTAAAEAMAMVFHHKNKGETISSPKFFVDHNVFSQTKEVLTTRAVPIGIELIYGDYASAQLDESYFGAIVQYPSSTGSVEDHRGFIQKAHAANAFVIMATDLLALTMLTTPGELGADVAVGSAQRLGVPMGYGGPHAAFFATREEFKRGIPGRIIGISIDAQNNRALRMALQTREQHIKREKATSNICTAQALLANMAAMYAVYHGPEGMKKIAERIHAVTASVDMALRESGIAVSNQNCFDTLTFRVADVEAFRSAAIASQSNFYYHADGSVSLSIDEVSSNCVNETLQELSAIFTKGTGKKISISLNSNTKKIPSSMERTSNYLTHPVFNTHHSESQMMRYIKSLENKDLSLNTSMISLGSCTMKLNAATELIPVSWPEFSAIHPFAPASQTKGYQAIISRLEEYLCRITGFSACSLQPNSGAQGEYAGLLCIRAYHEHRKESHRNIVLIPISAHGTNPASAIMAGMKVVVVKSTEEGHIDVGDLKLKAKEHSQNLAGLMVTYPSTHGVFEESIKKVCSIIHANGGLVYMDGANMNAQVGLTSPGMIGADVCHLNLHKTFAIPHGGGGPGVGPICVNNKLKPFLPGHQALGTDGTRIPAVSAAPYGSASILLISYAYIRMLGAEGVRLATEYAILNANYMKAKLEKYYKILYTGTHGFSAHEFIVDLRPFKTTAGIEAEDVAKRLMDYGFHAPTMSFPVPGTIMIEPTESEDKGELDRFCEALISIWEEIRAIEEGRADKMDNALKNAPHTQAVVCGNEWNRAYSREEAAFPLAYIIKNKFWPSIARINNTFGDRNLVCTCEPMESYVE